MREAIPLQTWYSRLEKRAELAEARVAELEAEIYAMKLAGIRDLGAAVATSLRFDSLVNSLCEEAEGGMKRRVVRWEEWPRMWTPILECGHTVRLHYTGLSDKDKVTAELEDGYFCSTCDRIEHRVSNTRGMNRSAAAGRFQAIFIERTYARSMAPHGKLSQDEELRFTEDLDDCWEKMTEKEREDAEQHFALRKNTRPKP